MSSVDDYINAAASAKLSNQAARISDGIYEPLVISRFLMIKDGYKGDSFVVEFFVGAARQQTVTLFRQGETVAPMPNQPGTLCGTAWGLGDKIKRDVAFSSIMQIFAAIFKWDKNYAESTDPQIVAQRRQIMSAAFADQGMWLRGYPVRVETYRAETKKKEIHTRCRFAHFEFTPEQIPAYRAAVEKASGV